MPGLDPHALFAPTHPLAVVVVRGTLVYLAIFAMLRIVLKRETAGLGVGDLLVVVLISDAAQNAMTGGYESVTEGVVLVATIIAWSWTLDWLRWKFPTLERLLAPSPLALVRDGRLLRRNMRRELITETELRSLLREQGVDDLATVHAVYMESDGQVSVIAKDATAGARRRRRGA